MSRETGENPNFIKSLAVIAIPLLSILAVAEIALHGRIITYSDQTFSGFDPVTLGFVSVLVLGVLLYELRRHGERTARLLVAAVTMSGTLAGLTLLQAWFAMANAGLGVFYLLVPPIAYAGLYFSIRDYSGSLPRKRSGIFRATSATMLGVVLGAFLPVLFTIPFLVVLSILDPLFLATNLLKRTMGTRVFDDLSVATTLPLVGIDVGLGDLMAYSLLATTSIVNSGVFVAIATTALILAGVLLTFQVARSRHVAPGLPLPLWLGILPSVIVLLMP